MRYNTQLEKIRMTEYGRYIQQVIEYLPKIEDKKVRSKIATEIVQVMAIITRVHLRDNPEIKQKLMDHLHIISGFMLDIDSPFPKPTPPEEIKPHPLSYSNPEIIKYKYHGKYIQTLIKRIAEMEDGLEKNELIKLTVILMKKFYYAWNKEHAKDSVIIEQMRELSNGKIILTTEQIEQIQESYRQSKEARNSYSSNGKKKKQLLMYNKTRR
ncbi:MAG: DUF4290 domain-containing protein [Bacteroidales bacterium]|nr:DUF4290 domain-containing protein [Bacteroidales bacterium]